MTETKFKQTIKITDDISLVYEQKQNINIEEAAINASLIQKIVKAVDAINSSVEDIVETKVQKKIIEPVFEENNVCAIPKTISTLSKLTETERKTLYKKYKSLSMIDKKKFAASHKIDPARLSSLIYIIKNKYYK